MKQAVVLAGGKGTRLRSVTGGKPKPLAPMGETTLLGHHLAALERHGFVEALVLVDYEAEQIRRWVSDNWHGVLQVSFLEDGTPRGTAGAVLAAYDRLQPEFLVTYADTLFEVQLQRFVAAHQAHKGCAATLFVHPNDHPHDSDLIELDDANRVLAFHPYPHPSDSWLPNMVNAALYCVRRESLRGVAEDMRQGVVDFGKHLFPAMLKRGLALYGYASSEYIKDAGTPERWEKVQRDLASGWVRGASLENLQRAVLTDRDGTLNKDPGHIARAEDLELFPGIGAAMRRLNDAHWLNVVVTNQPVLARGEATFEGMRRIHARLDTEIAADRAWVDGLFLCPHHPHGGYPGEVPELKINCDCRKPAAGLIQQARDRFNLDLKECWMVGDSTADIGSARAAGVSMVLVRTGVAGLDDKYPYEASFTVTDYPAAVEFILDTYPALAATLAPLTEDLAGGGMDVLVGGCARSGKSTAAGVIERELRRRGVACQVIQLDRFLRSEADRGAGLAGRYDIDGIARCMVAVAKRSEGDVSITLPFYSRRLRAQLDLGLEMTVPRGAVVIWEGVIAGLLRDTAPWAQCYLYMDADENARRERFHAYDQSRGLSEERSAKNWAERDEDEHPAIRATRALATHVRCFDAIFDSELLGAE